MDDSIKSRLVREDGLETPIRGQRAGFDSAAGKDYRENISFFDRFVSIGGSKQFPNSSITSYDDLCYHAALCVSSGLHGRLHVGLRRDKTALKIAFFYHSSWWRMFYIFVTLFNMALAVFESVSTWTTESTEYVDTVCQVLSLFCIALYIVDMLLLYRYSGIGFLKSEWIRLRIFIISVMLVNCIGILISPSLPHLARVLRPLLIIERLRNVRKISSSIVQSAPKIMNVLVLLLFHIVFFGAVAFILFRGIFGKTGCETDPRGCENGCNFFDYNPYEPSPTLNHDQYCSTFSHNCRDYFNTLFASMLQLFILLTTANYPDIMMPVYECEPLTALFFVVYILIGLYFLMSLILAVVYTHFSERTRTKFKKHRLKRQHSIDYGFVLLQKAKRMRMDDTLSFASTSFGSEPDRAQRAASLNQDTADPSDEAIELPEWAAMIRVLSPHIPEAIVHTLFYMESDEKGNSLRGQEGLSLPVINRDQFFKICKFARIKVKEKRRISFAPSSIEERANNWKYHLRQRLLGIVKTRAWTIVFDTLVIFNTIVLILVLAPGKHMFSGAASETINTMLLYVFVLELATQNVALGIWKYLRISWYNKIDFVAITAGLFVNVIGHVRGHAKNRAINTLGLSLLFLRMIRILRILRVLSEFHTVTNTIARVLPALMRYFAVLLVIFYMFAIVGMEMFSGVLINNNSTKFLESSYTSNGYSHNNFETLYNSFVVLFEQMVVNNWPIVMEGCVMATSWWALAYFLAFYLITVVTVMNVLIAFLLDAYQNHEKPKKSGWRWNIDDATQDDPPWLQLMRSTAKEHNLDISGYKVTLRTNAGDVYHSMYSTTEEQKAAEMRQVGEGEQLYGSNMVVACIEGSDEIDELMNELQEEDQ